MKNRSYRSGRLVYLQRRRLDPSMYVYYREGDWIHPCMYTTEKPQLHNSDGSQNVFQELEVYSYVNCIELSKL